MPGQSNGLHSPSRVWPSTAPDCRSSRSRRSTVRPAAAASAARRRAPEQNCGPKSPPSYPPGQIENHVAAHAATLGARRALSWDGTGGRSRLIALSLSRIIGSGKKGSLHAPPAQDCRADSSLSSVSESNRFTTPGSSENRRLKTRRSASALGGGSQTTLSGGSRCGTRRYLRLRLFC